MSRNGTSEATSLPGNEIRTSKTATIASSALFSVLSLGSPPPAELLADCNRRPGVVACEHHDPDARIPKAMVMFWKMLRIVLTD